MKKFRFPLQALLDLRRRRLDDMSLQIAASENRRREQEENAEALHEEAVRVGGDLAAIQQWTGAELRAASSHVRLLQQKRDQALRNEKKLSSELDALRSQGITARRAWKLLQNLRKRRLGEYFREVDRRLEEQATESHRGGWWRQTKEER